MVKKQSVDSKFEMTLGLTLFIFGLATHFITKYNVFRIPSLWQTLIILAGLLILCHAFVVTFASNVKWLYLFISLVLIFAIVWVANLDTYIFGFLKEEQTYPHLYCTTDADCIPSQFSASCCINKDYEGNITDIPSGLCREYTENINCVCVISEGKGYGYCQKE